MIDWKAYFKYKMKNFFKLSNFVNIELGYFVSFLIATVSALFKFNIGIPIGFLGFFICIIYNDAKIGKWRGNIREQYTIKGFEMRVKELEDENKKLKEQINNDVSKGK